MAIDAAIRRQLADCIRHLLLDILVEWNCELVGKGHIGLSSDECQSRCRWITYDPVFNSVEVRTVWLPVERVTRHLDVFVCLEFDKFERAGADRLSAHFARLHMARVNHRNSRCEQHRKCRLRTL